MHRHSTLVLVAALALQVAAPGPALPAWRQTDFLIGGFVVNTAPADPARLIRLQEAGLDFVHDSDLSFSADWGRLLVAQLDSLHAARPGFDLKAVLHVTANQDRPSGFTANPDVAANWTKIRPTLDPSAGLNRPSTLGWFVWDEPCTRAEMKNLVDLSLRMRSYPPTAGTLPFVNLLPIADVGARGCYGDAFVGGRDRVSGYAAYLDAYLSAFDGEADPAPLLSFDHYPFQIDGRESGTYFENLATARDRALAHGRPGARVPLWVIVQLASFKPVDAPFMRSPSIAQVRWQAWTAVAYGAKSISYWTTGTTADPDPRTGFRGGLLELDGRPTPKYDAVRRLNAELHALGPTLMKLDPVAVLRAAPGRQGGDERERIGSPDRTYNVVTDVDGAGRTDCMIGYFKGRESADDYLLVVNQSLTVARDFRLRLGTRADSVEVVDRESGRLQLVGRSLSDIEVRDLPPASAELYRVANPMLEQLNGVQEVRRRGQVVEYRLPGDVLRVDYATGFRSRVASLAGDPAPGLPITPEGVRRPAGWRSSTAPGSP